MKFNKLLFIFAVVYFAYLLFSIDPFYLDGDQSSHAMTGFFLNQLTSDWVNSPSFNPMSVYDYFKAYYVRYPKIVLQYGPVYPMINMLLPSQLFMKLVTAFFAVGTVVLVYFILKDLFSEEVGFLAAVITATSSVFVNYATMLMPNIPSVFFFTLGLFFYLKRSDSKFFSVLAGFLFGLSILAKEFAIVYVGAVCLITLKGFRKHLNKNLLLFIALFITLLPYIGLLVFSGGVEVLLEYPKKQLWYGERNQDPQWTELSGWLFFWQVIVQNYSVIALPLMIAGLYFAYKNDYKRVFYFTLIAYLGVTMVSDKAPQRILYGSVFFSGLIAYSIVRLYSYFKAPLIKVSFLFLVILMMVLSVPLYSPRINVPMSVVAQDLINDCPNCTVLIASEVGSVYSSYLMYESMIRDVNVSLRFIRPTVFELMSAVEVINSEMVNRVVVAGDLAFVKSHSETSGYADQVEFIINRYELVKVYDSDIVGKIYVFDTGITDFKEPPYCFTSVSMSKTFCSDNALPSNVF